MSTSRTFQVAGYPKEIGLRDNSVVELRTMTVEDGPALLTFFQGVPAEDRFYLKEDVTSPEVINRWVLELDYERALPVLAWAEGRVVADATLHRSRGHARRHVGELRILVAPEYRNRGLGTTLMAELANIANEVGLEKLYLEVVAEKEEAAIKAAEFAGFVRAGLLRNHAKDLQGHPRDLVLLEMPLGKWLEWWTF